MRPVYSRYGGVVGWINRPHVFAVDGALIACLWDDVVAAHDGTVLGFYLAGFFRDRAGAAVAFVDGAQGPPRLPNTFTPPVAPLPIRADQATRPPQQYPPAPAPQDTWGQDWFAFVKARP